MARLDCEVLVVGSGPGGAMTSSLLAEAGFDVLMVEEGRHHSVDSSKSYTLDEMNHVREKLVEASQEGETEYLRRIDVLERRVRKLHEQLQDAEHELKARRASDEFHENGRSSVYRDVQGLDADDESYDEKLNLLNAIFEANAELRRISEQAQGGPTA